MFIYALFSGADTFRLKFEIDIPEASQERSEPFSVTTFEASDRSLHEILPNYVSCGSTSPSVKRFDPRKVPCLQPLAVFTKTAHQSANQNERLMHLHFVKSKDLTLMCVAWQHVVLDAPALRLIVDEWECLLAKGTDMFADNHALEIDGLKDNPNLDELTSELQRNTFRSLPGWAAVTLWGGLKLKLLSKIYSLRYPRTFGTAYMPPNLVEALVTRVRSSTGPGVVLSRNDIVAGWFYKVGLSSARFTLSTQSVRSEQADKMIGGMRNLSTKNIYDSISSCESAWQACSHIAQCVRKRFRPGRHAEYSIWRTSASVTWRSGADNSPFCRQVQRCRLRL